MGDSDPATTFTYVAREAGRRGLAFLFVRESLEEPRIAPAMKRAFGGPLVANQDLDPDSAARLVASGQADAVSWGRLFISNPDLPRRLALGAPLNPPDPDTFYGGGAAGYTDYPALADA
jgi:NADPH2 dehydrogenase